MRRNYLFHAFFLSVFVILLAQFGMILVPFATPILASIVLWILAHPIHIRLKRVLPRWSDGFHAALSTIAVTTLIVVPLVTLFWVLINESRAMAPMLSGWGTTLHDLREGNGIMDVPFVQMLAGNLRQMLGIGRVEFERTAVSLGSDFFGMVQNAGAWVARNTVLFALNVFMTIFIAFFLFREGESFFMQLYRLVPMRAAHKDRVVEKLKRTVTEIVRGSILTAFFQSLCAMLGYFIVGVPGALTLGVATGVAAFIPIVGTALIWLPMGIFFLTQDHVGKAIFIFGWGIIVVSTFDNLLRTLFIGRKTHLPFLFIFLGILGGARLYGPIGLLLGPLLVAVIPVFIDIYREHYLRASPAETIELADEPN